MRPDIPGDPNPNSRRTLGQDQEYFDQYNFITRNPDTAGCKEVRDENGFETHMETYHRSIDPFPYGRRLPPVGLQPIRSTVTVSHIYQEQCRSSNSVCI